MNNRMYVKRNGAWWEIFGDVCEKNPYGVWIRLTRAGQFVRGAFPEVPGAGIFIRNEDFLSGPQVFWIISEGNEDYDNGEFGIEIDGIPYFYYKDPDPMPSLNIKYRRIEKREFGEVIRKNNESLEEVV